MRETILTTHYPQWLHFLVRLLLILLLILLFSILSEGSGRKARQRLTREQIAAAEERLSDLGYWTGPVDGIFDGASQHALIAFRKVEHRKRAGELTAGDLEALRIAIAPQPRESSYAHIEVDLTRQILMMVDGNGIASHILSVCTGNEQLYQDGGRWERAHTPRGRFVVTRKINGWRLSSLGLLYYPNYIYQGIAIHGSLAIRTYPDSHGCIRIPMFASKRFSELTPVGTIVFVYE
ncbi:MAG TPA: L,D-transpeptidase family protein [Pyrinomonadaceae bacterium]|nr:L,D-transpeptidase family protein [Pyrinomonadaceae bacterium]